MLTRYVISICVLTVFIMNSGCATAELTPIEDSPNTSPVTRAPPIMTVTVPPAITATALLITTPTPLLPTQIAVSPTRISPQNLVPITADTATQVERLNILSGHTNRVMTLTFSWDGTYLASSSQDNTIKVWDVWNGLEVFAVRMRMGDLNAIAFSPTENWLASPDTIWDVESMQVVQNLVRGRREVGHVAFSPGGSTLAVAIADQPITLWDVASGQVLLTFAEQADNPTFDIEFSPDGTLIASGESFGTVRLWDVASGQVINTFEYSKDSDVHDIAFSPDGRFLASAGTDTTIRVWDLASGQMVQTLWVGNGMYGVTFSPDGSLLASAVCDRTVKLWEVATGRLLRSLPHADELITVVFSPDGILLASAGYDNLIYLWGVTR